MLYVLYSRIQAVHSVKHRADHKGLLSTTISVRINISKVNAGVKPGYEWTVKTRKNNRYS